MLPLLNETKYQSHVRVRVRFRSGACRVHGSCPVRVWVRVWIIVRVCVWFATGFVSGFVSGSCLLRVRFVSEFVSGSCPGSCPVRVCLVFGFVLGSRLFRIRVRDRVHVWVRIRVRVGGFVSGFVSSSCLVHIWFTSGSYLDPYAVLVWGFLDLSGRSGRIGLSLVYLAR